jgi:hypothetical protein
MDVRTRRLIMVGGAVVAVGLAAATWVTVRGMMARSDLLGARTRLAALEADINAGHGGDPAAVAARVAAISRAAASARSLTGDPVWSLTGRLPVLGCPARAAHRLAAAFDDLTHDALPGIATLGPTLDPTRLRRGSTLRLDAFRAAAGPLAEAHTALGRFSSALARVPTCGRLGRSGGLTAARAEAVGAVSTILPTVDSMRLATRLVPDMLGGAGVRRYLLIVQNPAQSRANGGVLGGFGVITASAGHVSLEGISGNDTLPGPSAGGAGPPPLPPNLAALYGEFTPDRLWANANVTPDYPTAARFYTGLFQAATGQRVDGTISLDPETLSYLLAATRPAVLPDGTVVTPENLVPLVALRMNARIGGRYARDSFIAAVGRATYDAVASGAGRGRALLSALDRAVNERRLEVSSTHPAEEALLSTTEVGGALPSASGAYLAVVTQNAAGGKLDYWLRRSTDYRAVRRPDGSADVTVTVSVTNTAPPGLPASVRRRDVPGGPPGNPDAENLIWLSVYTGRGSGVRAVSVDGRPTPVTSGIEKDHPVAATTLAIRRGQTRRVVLRIWEPVASALVVRPQPLIAPDRLTVSGLPLAGRADAG